MREYVIATSWASGFAFVENRKRRFSLKKEDRVLSIWISNEDSDSHRTGLIQVRTKKIVTNRHTITINITSTIIL